MPRPALPRRPVLGALLGSLLVATPAGCTNWPAPTGPMPVRRIAARCTPSSRCIRYGAMASTPAISPPWRIA